MGLTYEWGVSLVPVSNLQIVVLALAHRAGGLDLEHVPKVDPDKVPNVRRDRPEARNVLGIVPRVHGAVELLAVLVSDRKVLAVLLDQLRVNPLGRRDLLLGSGSGEGQQKQQGHPKPEEVKVNEGCHPRYINSALSQKHSDFCYYRFFVVVAFQGPRSKNQEGRKS